MAASEALSGCGFAEYHATHPLLPPMPNKTPLEFSIVPKGVAPVSLVSTLYPP